MTPLPFHDSVHNMYENPPRSSSHSTNGSGQDLSGQHVSSVAAIAATTTTMLPQQQSSLSTTTAATSPTQQQIKTNDLNLFKVNAHVALNFTPNSAVFLENSDILNDRDYPKLYHRHSTIYVQPTTDANATENLDKLLGKDVRRYSDTRLLKNRNTLHYLHDNDDDDDDQQQPVPIFNVTNVLGVSIPSNVDAMGPADTSITITDIIFENSGQNFDPLELNIQEMLELDVRQQHHQPRHMQHQSQMTTATVVNGEPTTKGRHSLNNVSTGGIEMTNSFVENRKFFKSLPNLSASSENLLQK